MFPINIFQKVLKNIRDTWFGKAMFLFDRASISYEELGNFPEESYKTEAKKIIK
jgi:hypothetical protein